jgi:uncharacterized membrane protein YfcA
MEYYLWLIPVGFAIGAVGTIIGAGGGFLLVPLLLLLYANESPEIITGISLAVVFFNAGSGSLAYGRMKRIDFKSGIIFSIATMPGAVLGALSTAYVPRRQFDALFGILMVATSLPLMFRPAGIKATERKKTSAMSQTRQEEHRIPLLSHHHLSLGVGLSTLAGYVSSLLGIGAGFIYVPVFVYFLDFPVHTATATSQFILAISAFTGSVTHILSGIFQRGLRRTIALAVGVILGAQVGARSSERLNDQWIIRGLAVALIVAGTRLILMAW